MALAYQNPDASLTLAEGVDEYRRAFPDLIDPGQVDEGLGCFLRAHDRCHVLFGLDTSIRDEAMADTWTLFASDVSWKEYASYLRHPEVNNILAEAGYWTITVESVKHIGDMVAAWRHARRMKAKWPFWHNDDYLGLPVCEIRLEFGIVLVPHPASRVRGG